jgi:PadR family transcriptional regulator PadR
MPDQLDLIQGTLDMLILKAVSLGPLHGYGVLLRIQQISGDQLAIQQGSLYPALYHLTPTGRRQLRAEADKWNRMATLIAGILSTTPDEI